MKKDSYIIGNFDAKPSLMSEDGKVESWTEISKIGEYKGYGQKGWKISDTTFDQIIQNFNDAAVSNQIPVHIGHPNDDAEAVGWIREVKKAEGKLMALVEWSVEFADKIKKGAWKYVSCEIVPNLRHPNTGKDIGAYLMGLGVTNIPFIRNLEPITLSQSHISEDAVGRLYLFSENGEANNMAMEEEKKDGEEVKAEDKQLEDKVEEKAEDKKEEESKDMEAVSASASLELIRSILNQPELDDAGLAEIIAKADPEKVKAVLSGAPEEKVDAEPSAEMQASQLAFSNLQAKFSDLESEVVNLRKTAAEFNSIKVKAAVDAKIKEGVFHAKIRDHLIQLGESADMNVRNAFSAMMGNTEPTIIMNQLIDSSTEDTVTQPEEEKLGSFGQQIVNAALKNQKK